VDLALHRPRGLELSLDELPFYRFALERIFEAGFGIHKRGDSTLKSGVALPIFLKGCQISFQADLFRALLVEKALDCLVEQLVDGSSFEFAEVLQGGPLFSVNS